jgi:hypothetical protein
MIEEKEDRCLRIARREYGKKTTAYRSGAIVRCRKGDIWKGLKEDKFLDDFNQIDKIITQTYSKEIYDLLLGMFPKAKEIIDYQYNDELGQPFAEWRRAIFEIDNHVLVGPENVDSGKIELDSEMTADRQAKYDQYIKDKEAGKPAKYFRDNNADPRTIDYTKLPPITLLDKGGSYEPIDGAHRIFLAQKANKPLKAYIWKKQKNTHPNVDKIKALFNNIQEAKKESLHKWFSHRGGGWVDCNTCRDGKCKPCGRQKGEERAKYPSCRPTPAACKDPGKGKTWGKTK